MVKQRSNGGPTCSMDSMRWARSGLGYPPGIASAPHPVATVWERRRRTTLASRVWTRATHASGSAMWRRGRRRERPDVHALVPMKLRKLVTPHSSFTSCEPSEYHRSQLARRKSLPLYTGPYRDTHRKADR